MSVELEDIINLIADRRIKDGPIRQTTQSGQIMLDAKEILFGFALQTHPDDEVAMQHIVTNPELIAKTFDLLIQRYRSETQK